MTRHPAAEKRLTVAWPMPRLAPVRSSVRRGLVAGWHLLVFQLLCAVAAGEAKRSTVRRELRIGSSDCFAPWADVVVLTDRAASCATRGRCRTGEGDAVVQPKRPLLPELDLLRDDAVTRPVRRPRHRADRRISRYSAHRLLEREAAFERSRLVARPGADLRHARARREIASASSAATGSTSRAADLALQRLPIERQRRLRRLRSIPGPSRCRRSCRRRSRARRSPSTAPCAHWAVRRASTVASVMAFGIDRLRPFWPRRTRPRTGATAHRPR